MPRRSSILVTGFAATCLWLVVAAAPAVADAGPHVASLNSGVGGLNADSCAGCHRAHAALGVGLIAATHETTLCLTCHGSASTGATTNVIDGILAGTTQGLRGGGFVRSVMDTSWTGTAALRASTSAHAYDATATGTMWGSGAIGSGPGKTGVPLACVNCHNPHGNDTYRILRPIPIGSDAATGSTVPDEATKVYAVASTQNRYFGEVYGGSGYGWEWMYSLDEWCSACHTRYDGVESGTGHIDSGDPIFKYRHMTRYPTGSIDCGICHGGSGGIQAPNPLDVTYRTAHEPVCENCHVAHGSSAQMGTYSGGVAWPDGATSPSGAARSSLLRLDNRGVCAGCHDPTQ